MTGMRRHLRWTVLDTPGDVAQRACELISAAAARAIADRGAFSIVLAGGSTPRRCYEMLRDTAQDWPRWQVFFGDERCLPADHPDRNSMMARDALLDRVAIPKAHVHAIPAEQGAAGAARTYARTLETVRPFDMVILGLGEDGHTASLFPGHAHAAEEAVHAVFDAPKPPPERVTLAVSTLADCRNLLFIVTGASKYVAVRAWQRGEPALPIVAIKPQCRAEVLLDSSAAGGAMESG